MLQIPICECVLLDVQHSSVLSGLSDRKREGEIDWERKRESEGGGGGIT